MLLSYLSPVLHPSTIWFVPLLGLGYPIILICSLLVFIISLFQKNKWKYILGTCLILGIGFHTRVFAVSPNSNVSVEDSFELMSYNVHLFGRYESTNENAHNKRKEIIEYVKNENPDVVAFQEFYYQDRPYNFDTKDTLIKLLGYQDHHEKYSHKVKGRQNFGIMIMSKFPIIEKGNIAFEGTTHNYCIYADIVRKKDTFRLYNVHLQSISFQKEDYSTIDSLRNYSGSGGTKRVIHKILDAYPIRSDQTDKVISHIKASPYPVIVCGDFNDTPMSYTYSKFNSFLVDAYRTNGLGIGSTYAGNIPLTRIDYIFHSKLLASGNFKIQKQKLSDHYAILCRIEQ